MKTIITLLLVCLLSVPAILFSGDSGVAVSRNCGCSCCKGKEVCCCHEGENPQAAEHQVPPPEPKRYPLRGVIREVDAVRGALLVKHQEIPGYMHAMTMSFKVDPETLKRVKAGDEISAVLLTREKIFWLDDVKVEK